MQGPEPYLEELGVELPGAVNGNASAVLEPSHRVVVNGQLYWASSPSQTAVLRASPHLYSGPVRDPVSGRWFSPRSSSTRREVGGQVLYFASPANAEEFDREPERYLTQSR